MKSIKDQAQQYGDMLDAQMKRKIEAQKEINSIAASLLKKMKNNGEIA